LDGVRSYRVPKESEVMNINEFSALKVGDKISSMLGAEGTVTEVDDRGIRVRWGDQRSTNDPTFFFSVNSRAWTHWSKIDEATT